MFQTFSLVLAFWRAFSASRTFWAFQAFWAFRDFRGFCSFLILRFFLALRCHMFRAFTSLQIYAYTNNSTKEAAVT